MFTGFREWETHISNEDEAHHTWITGIESFQSHCPICGQGLRWPELRLAYNSSQSQEALLSHLAHHMEKIALLAIPWEQSDRKSFNTTDTSTDTSANYTLSSKSDKVSVSGWSSTSSGG